MSAKIWSLEIIFFISNCFFILVYYNRVKFRVINLNITKVRKGFIWPRARFIEFQKLREGPVERL
jgi:hypothetical protein